MYGTPPLESLRNCLSRSVIPVAIPNMALDTVAQVTIIKTYLLIIVVVLTMVCSPT